MFIVCDNILRWLSQAYHNPLSIWSPLEKIKRARKKKQIWFWLLPVNSLLRNVDRCTSLSTADTACQQTEQLPVLLCILCRQACRLSLYFWICFFFEFFLLHFNWIYLTIIPTWKQGKILTVKITINYKSNSKHHNVHHKLFSLISFFIFYIGFIVVHATYFSLISVLKIQNQV